jgi:hypothetical protein
MPSCTVNKIETDHRVAKDTTPDSDVGKHKSNIQCNEHRDSLEVYVSSVHCIRRFFRRFAPEAEVAAR